MRADFHYIRTTGQFEKNLEQAKKNGNAQAFERAYQKLATLLQDTDSAYSHGLDHKRIRGIHRVRMKDDWRAWFFPISTKEGKKVWVLSRLVKHENNGRDYERIAAQIERFQIKHSRNIASSIDADATTADIASIADLIRRTNAYQQRFAASPPSHSSDTSGGGGGAKCSILLPEVSIYDRRCIIIADEQDTCIDTLCRGIYTAGETGQYIGVAVGAPGAGKTLIIDKLAKRLDESVCYLAESNQ